MTQTSAAIAREIAAAQKRVMKKALRSKKTARAFLYKAGFITKDGKPTKPYR